jgi:predicted phage-related endonuclease
MATLKIIPGSPEWNAERAKGIGGSECASMFNAGYGCERRLIMEKRGVPADYQRPKREEDILERGTELEDVVAAKFERETGLKVRRQPSRVSRTHPHARVNMDRQIVAVDENYLVQLTQDKMTGMSPLEEVLRPEEHIGPGVLECKTINEWDFRRLLAEGFGKHEHYIFQLQHSLAVTGYKWGVFAFLEPTWWQFVWFPMARNEMLCQEILRRVEATWQLIEDESAPLPEPLPAGDKRCSNCLWRKTCRGEEYLEQYAGADFASDYVKVEDPTLIELATDYRNAREAAESANTVVETIKTRIQNEMESRGLDKVEIPGVQKFNWYTVAGRKSWDGKALLGEINALRKTGDEQLVQIAERIENCQKQGQPYRTFKPISV